MGSSQNRKILGKHLFFIFGGNKPVEEGPDIHFENIPPYTLCAFRFNDVFLLRVILIITCAKLVFHLFRFHFSATEN